MRAHTKTPRHLADFGAFWTGTARKLWGESETQSYWILLHRQTLRLGSESAGEDLAEHLHNFSQLFEELMWVNPESMLLTKAERAFPMRTAKKAGALRLCEIGSCCQFVLHALQFCNWAGSSKSVNKPRATFLLGTLRRAVSAMSFTCTCFKWSCSLFLFLRFLGQQCATLVPCYTQEEDDFKDPWLEPDKPKGKGKGRGKDKAAESASASAPQSFDVKGDWVCWVTRRVVFFRKSLLGLARSKSEPVDTVAAAAQVAAKMQAGNLPEGKRCDMCFSFHLFHPIFCTSKPQLTRRYFAIHPLVCFHKHKNIICNLLWPKLILQTYCWNQW